MMSFSQKLSETKDNPVGYGRSFVEISEAIKRNETAREAWKRRLL